MSSNSVRRVTAEIRDYFFQYMRKKLALVDSLEETFCHPDNPQNLALSLVELEKKRDLLAINQWLVTEVTEDGQRRFWTAHRSIKWTRKNPARDRIVIVPLANALKAHTGIADLNHAIASLLPKKVVKSIEGELAAIQHHRGKK